MLEQTIDRIRQFRQRESLSISKLARMSGCARRILANMDTPTWSPSLPTIRKLEACIPAGFRSRRKAKGNGAARHR